MTQNIAPKKVTKPLSPFLASLIKRFENMPPHREKIFKVLDDLALLEPDLLPEIYLKHALAILSYASPTFIRQRSEDFFYWLLKTLQEKEGASLCHTVAFPFHAKKILGIVTLSPSPNISAPFLKQFLHSQFPKATLVEGSLISFPEQQNHYFEIQTETLDQPNTILTALQKKLQETDLFPLSSTNVSINREFFIKSLRWIMNETEHQDLPQVCIDLSHQEQSTYIFSTLVCHWISPGAPSLKSTLTHPQIIVESVTTLTQKEGAILKITVPSKPETTLLEARVSVANLLTSLLGPFRDVNGGLLEKVQETYTTLVQKLDASPQTVHQFLNSIHPQELQAITPIETLITLFNQMTSEKNPPYETGYTLKETEAALIVSAKSSSPSFIKQWTQSISQAHPKATFSTLEYPSTTLVGHAFLYPTPEEVTSIKALINSTYHSWTEKKENKQVLKLCSTGNFMSLDPRIGYEERSSYLCKSLFEGLMRINPKGKAENALVENYTLSKDGKRYRFYLKKTTWSDGTPVTAEDFVHSWRTSLTPGFLSSLSYLFFIIKNAKDIKKGKLSPSCLGVQASGPQILDVELNHPAPHFLELCSLTVFSPIPHNHDQTFPSWPQGEGKSFICNGPFFLEKQTTKEVVLKKNSHYYESSAVELEKVTITLVSKETALDHFKKKEFDALLDPFFKGLTPIDHFSSDLRIQQRATQTQYLWLNCSQKPFSNPQIRKALSLAMSRESIAKKLRLDAKPQYNMFSPIFKHLWASPCQENHFEAKRLLQKAYAKDPKLEEVLSDLIFYTWKQHQEISEIIVNHLNATLGFSWTISVLQDNSPNQFLSEKLHVHMYGWTERLHYPEYFFSIFSDATLLRNSTHWSSLKIQSLIKKSEAEKNLNKRNEIYREIEEHLLQELPLIPILNTPKYCRYWSSVLLPSANTTQQFDLRYAKKL